MLKQLLDDFKKTIDKYMASHGKASTYYRQTISYGLLKHAGDSSNPTTLRDVLKPDHPVEHELEDALKKLMQHCDISNESLSAGFLRDCGVTISELREHFAAQLEVFYNAETVAQIMDLAGRKLAVKLADAMLYELGRFEQTDHYGDALEYVLDAANLWDQYGTLCSEAVTHAEVRAALRNPLVGNLDRRARFEYRKTR